MENELTNQDRFTLLSRGFLYRADMEKLLNCKASKANAVMRELSDGLTLPSRGYIPAKVYMEKYNISIKEVFAMAEMERRLQSIK